MKTNKYASFKIVRKNNASGTNHTSSMIVADSPNDYFANIGKILAAGSNCSNLGEMNIPKSIDKTILLYPTDANEIFSSIMNCKITKLSGLTGLSNNLLKIAGPVISDFLAAIFSECIQVGFFSNVLKITRMKPLSKTGVTQNPKHYRWISLLTSLSEIFN